MSYICNSLNHPRSDPCDSSSLALMTIYPIVLSFLDTQLADGWQVGVNSQYKPSSRQP